MANTRLSMRKIKEVLRLTHHGGLSDRQVALSLNISRSTVKDYRARAQRAGLSWPLPETLSERALEQRLFPPPVTVEPSAKALPDFDYIYRELKAHRKFNLTLDLLWQEYKEQHPEGYQYSQFCELYRRWRDKLDYCMRQDHRGGEKLFVDYGEGLKLFDPQSGEAVSTELFVAVWGASNYTYAEATLTQQLPDWIGSHTEPFLTLAVFPRSWCPIVLKSAVQSGVPLRARVKPDLCGNGQPLRDLRLTGAPSPSQGQGQSRDRSADCQTLDSGRATSSHLLQPRRTQWRHPTNCSSA